MRKMVTLKKVEMIDLYNALVGITEKYNKNFTYAVTYAKKSIANEVESLLESIKPSDSYKEYENLRSGIVGKYSEKDSEGNPIVKNGGIKLSSDKINECKKELSELDEKYSDVLEERQNDYKNFESVLEQTIDVQLEMVDWEYVPDTMDQKLMDVLLPIIER